MIKFCFAGNVFSPLGRFVSSGTNLLAHQAVKHTEGVSELLPEEDVQKLKGVSKRLPLQVWEIVRRSVEAYIQKLAGMEEEFESIGFGMWKDRSEMGNSSKWVEKLRKCFDERVKR